MPIEDSTLLVTAIFILILACCLLGFFVYIITATRSDGRNAIIRLRSTQMKLVAMQNVLDRTFQEFGLLIERKFKFMLQFSKPKQFAVATQANLQFNDADFCSVGIQTSIPLSSTSEDSTLLGRLPPLLVKPALSTDVVIPINGE